MKKRILIGLLTIGMIAQSLSVPVMAAPTDSVNEELSAETLSEVQPDDGSDGQPGEPEKDQTGEITVEESEEQTEERPGAEKSDDTIEEPDAQPGETPEEQSGDETGEQTGESEEDQSGAMPEEQPEESDETPDKQVKDQPEDTELLQPSGEKLEYIDVSDGVYQAGAFSVFGESADAKYAPYSVMPNATASTIAEAEEYFYQQLLARKDQIDMLKYNIPVSKLKALLSGVVNDHPDLYYVRSGCSYLPSGDIVSIIYPMYVDNIDDLDDAAFQAGMQEALSVIKPGMTELEKAVVLHDYLAVNCEYDKVRLDEKTLPQTSYSAYGVLADGIAVCQGYALAYKLLLNKVGIECYMVTSDSMNHAWNLIVLNGEYYQVDVTWDDPTWDMIGRSMHTYMFRSDASFANHSDWEITSGSEVVKYTATDTRYDSAFWTDCRSPLVITEDGCYFVAYENSSAYIKKKESLADITDTGTTVKNIGKWPVWGGSGSWQGTYSGLFQMDGRLYYNDKSSIYSIAPDGTDQRTEFEADTTNGYIYGSALCHGKVLYCLRQTPNMAGKETVLTADITASGGGSESGGQGGGGQEDDDQNDDEQDGDQKPETYEITYILYGGTNNSANPSTYTSETDTIILQDAVRDGYRFEGWYRDPSFYTRVTQIAKGSTGNITLYAKWTAEAGAGSNLPTVDLTPAAGNIVMGFSGTYYTESADKILNRLNAIRLEACKEGVRNPLTGQPLTLADYVPLQWSSDLEAIARLRAAEATVNQAHTRPNGQGCFTVTTSNHEQSWAENLAWNWSGLMAGIEQWYDEKDDWVKQTGKTTGHYTSIISPGYNYVAVGAFRLTSGGWYSVAQEFSYKSSLDDRKNPEQGKCTQYMEVQGSKVSALAFDKNLASAVKEGDNYQLSLDVTVKYADYYGTSQSYSGPYLAGGNWTSSDNTVLAVDNMGLVTAKAKGVATISVSAGSVSASKEISVYGKDESPILITPPTKTTYKVGQKIDLKGGKVTYVSGSTTTTADLTSGMISGFDSSRPGICTVTVVYKGYGSSFDTLIVEEPKLTAVYGQSLKNVPLPTNEYGTYSWKDGAQKLDTVGVQTFEAIYTPKDQQTFQVLSDLNIQITVQMELDNKTDVAFKSNLFTYNGTAQEPKVVVSVSDTVLAEGQDYLLSYQNNKDAGTAVVIVEGINCYYGSVSRSFEIKPAQITIKALDKAILIGTQVPPASAYEYEVSGLMPGDKLTAAPVMSCSITGTAAAGRYDIIPDGADAGPNYIIQYVNGKLTVASEYVSCTVTFDVQGHGAAPEDYIGIKVGSMIDRPDPDPAADGYRFDGWYQDTACTKVWNFDTDIVQSDITLYAKWLQESKSGSFALQEISDVYYTGKACKPIVSVYDGETLLKAGKDYQIKYYNNINANKDNKRKTAGGEGKNFNAELPYVEITGKGNYTEVVKVNFNILKTSIDDGSENPAAGVTLKVSDQLVSAKKVLKPFSSIKYVKSMKQDTDYMLSLTVVNARDQYGKSLTQGLALDNAAIPAGYEGEFLLTVRGMGNFEGSICKTIQVTDKSHLIKNAKITLGKNLKDIEYQGKAIELTPAEYNAADVFTVKCGNTFLRYQKDFTMSYRNNNKVGKAELIITGIGEYAGSKTMTFNIKGKAFTAKTVMIDERKSIEDQVYTGKAWTQNDVILIYGQGTDKEEKLTYGTHYTISYSKNVNKGTASMTFKGIDRAGYSGSFKKTFKIAAGDIAQAKQAPGMQNITIGYSKSGAKPVDEIVLTNRADLMLYNGKDYTLKYTNNKAVAKSTDAKPPTITVKGKGNYTGEMNVFYTIVKGDLDTDRDGTNITIKTSSLGYQENKSADYAYKPSVKLMDGKTALRAGTDYEIAYVKNTQADYENYMQKLKNRSAVDDDIPRAVITETAESNYKLSNPIIVLLPIYQNKLTKSNLTVEIGEAVYTGGQVTPKVTVYYQGESKNILLKEGEDYSLTFGTNNKSGKNKGSITISGIAPYYGGDVALKFEIKKRPISY